MFLCMGASVYMKEMEDISCMPVILAVSYTHLDVYKRQAVDIA